VSSGYLFVHFVCIYIIYTEEFTCVIGIKKYIVGLIIKTSSDAVLMEREKVYLGKLNMILVQVSCCHISLPNFLEQLYVKTYAYTKEIKAEVHCWSCATLHSADILVVLSSLLSDRILGDWLSNIWH